MKNPGLVKGERASRSRRRYGLGKARRGKALHTHERPFYGGAARAPSRTALPPPARAVCPLRWGPAGALLGGLRAASIALSAIPSCPRPVGAGHPRCEDVKWRPLAAPRAASLARGSRAGVPHPPGPRPGLSPSAADSSARTKMLLAVCSFYLRNVICDCSADPSNTIRVRWWGFFGVFIGGIFFAEKFCLASAWRAALGRELRSVPGGEAALPPAPALPWRPRPQAPRPGGGRSGV